PTVPSSPPAPPLESACDAFLSRSFRPRGAPDGFTRWPRSHALGQTPTIKLCYCHTPNPAPTRPTVRNPLRISCNPHSDQSSCRLPVARAGPGATSPRICRIVRGSHCPLSTVHCPLLKRLPLPRTASGATSPRICRIVRGAYGHSRPSRHRRCYLRHGRHGPARPGQPHHLLLHR